VDMLLLQELLVMRRLGINLSELLNALTETSVRHSKIVLPGLGLSKFVSLLHNLLWSILELHTPA